MGARARVAALRMRGPVVGSGSTVVGGPPGPAAPAGADGASPPGPPSARAPDRSAAALPASADPVGGWVPDLHSRRRNPRLRPVRGGDSGDSAAAASDHGPDPAPWRGRPLPFGAQGVGRAQGGAREARSGEERAGDLADAEASGAARGPGDAPGEGWAARLVRGGPWGALAQRWVPEPLRNARVDPGRRGAVLLSVIAALAAVVAAVGVWWGRPEPRPVTPVALAAAPTGDGTPTPAPASDRPSTAVPGRPAALDVPGAVQGPVRLTPMERSGPIVVSVTGRVHRPGLVTLTADVRVADAISAAGGPLDPADLTGLNLAARLSDGDSVVVTGSGGSHLQAGSPAGDPGVAGGPTASPGPPVNLNTADAAALQQLPGVGPVTAAAIIAWRTDHGPFASVEQLQAISGIGPARYAQIAPRATV